MILKCDYHGDEVVSVKVPEKVIMKVIETGTASGTDAVTKLVTLENGIEVSAPDFVNVGDSIEVNLNSIEYSSRV
jgi:elongation factor P